MIGLLVVMALNVEPSGAATQATAPEPVDTRYIDTYEAGKAQRDKEYEDSVKAVEAAEAAQKKRCGKYLGKVSVGMAWSRVKECAGPFTIKAAGAGFKIYEAQGGLVRVEAGKVTRVFYR